MQNSLLEENGMEIIDNSDGIEQLLQFSQNDDKIEYYKFSTILRLKDYTSPDDCPIFCKRGGHERNVYNWFITSIEQYRQLLPEMKRVTELFNGRLYVTLDRKDGYKTFASIRDQTNKYIDDYVLNKVAVSINNINRLASSASSLDINSASKGKRWLFDVDTKDINVVLQVERLCHEHHLLTVETVNGYHVIADRKFNARQLQLPADVELKTNALTLVYRRIN